MILRMNNNAEITLKRNNMVEFSKGIWNRETVLMSIEEGNNKELMNLFAKLQQKERINIKDEFFTQYADELQYLEENKYIVYEGEKNRKQSVWKELNNKKVLLIASQEFREIIRWKQNENIAHLFIDELMDELNISYNYELDSLDAYTLLEIRNRCKMVLDKYEEITFICCEPNLGLLKVLSKVMLDLEKKVTYSLIDNNMFFHFATVPYETPCFNCFNLRIRARIDEDVQLKKASFQDNMQISNDIALTVSNINYQLIMDMTLKLLIDNCGQRMRRNVGRVLVIDLNDFEVSDEKLYRVPYCEVCGT